MKKYLIISMIIVSIAGCVSNGGHEAAAKESQFDQALISIGERAPRGELTFTDAAQQQADLARKYYPADYGLHALRDYKILIAMRFDRKEITQQEYAVLWSERQNSFFAQRQSQQASETAANNRAANILMIQNAGDIMRRSTVPTTTNCISRPVGASVSTTCY